MKHLPHPASINIPADVDTCVEDAVWGNMQKGHLSSISGEVSTDSKDRSKKVILVGVHPRPQGWLLCVLVGGNEQAE